MIRRASAPKPSTTSGTTLSPSPGPELDFFQSSHPNEKRKMLKTQQRKHEQIWTAKIVLKQFCLGAKWPDSWRGNAPCTTGPPGEHPGPGACSHCAGWRVGEPSTGWFRWRCCRWRVGCLPTAACIPPAAWNSRSPAEKVGEKHTPKKCRGPICETPYYHAIVGAGHIWL